MILDVLVTIDLHVMFSVNKVFFCKFSGFVCSVMLNACDSLNHSRQKDDIEPAHLHQHVQHRRSR